MEQLRQRYVEDLKLKGLSARSCETYLKHIDKLARYFRCSPAVLSIEQIREYFLYMKDVKKYSESFFSQGLSAVKWLFANTLKKEWDLLEFVKPRSVKKLPDVLSISEVRTILSQIRLDRYRVCLSVIYSLGLRLQEGTHLQVRDIDSGRMLVHVRNGKGGKDRFVPLPQRTLELMRSFWLSHKNKVLLFPAAGRGESPVVAATTTNPMPFVSLQIVLREVVQELNMHKRITAHTFRHSYATHLMEAGVHMRLVQCYLGHSSPATTAKYLHLTSPAQAAAHQTIHQLMADL
jgi:site-specific recombinase XerD